MADDTHTKPADEAITRDILFALAERELVFLHNEFERRSDIAGTESGQELLEALGTAQIALARVAFEHADDGDALSGDTALHQAIAAIKRETP